MNQTDLASVGILVLTNQEAWSRDFISFNLSFLFL